MSGMIPSMATPSGWRVMSLAGCGQPSSPAIKAGPFGSSLTKDSYSRGGYKIYGQEQVIRQDAGYGDYYIDANKYRQLSTCSVRPGDVLMSLVGTTGRVLVLPTSAEPGIINPRLIRIRTDHDVVRPGFLAQFIRSSGAQVQLEALSQGGTMGVLNAGTVASLVVPVPALSEQDAILDALDAADELVNALERMIAKKHSIKQGMMQELLTGRTRLPGVTGSWAAGTFEELAAQVKERTLPAQVSPDTPLVELDQIESGTGRLLARSTASNATSLKSIFNVGDILFGKLRAYLRKYWMADTNGLCTTEIWALRPKPGVSGEFVRFIVETDGFIEVASGAYGTHMPRSDWGTVRRYQLMIPGSAEQAAIAGALVDADREIDVLRARLDKARAIKHGMMQELLTGRTRLPVQEAIT